MGNSIQPISKAETAKTRSVNHKHIPQPVLVTGAHRTGTTWVGKILATAPELAYISEPLNIHHRPGVFQAQVSNWYTYICTQNEDDYLEAYHKTLNLNYNLGAEIRSIRSQKDLLRMGRDAWIFWDGKLHRARALLKDPFAVFSIGWFIQRFDAEVVVVVRHPAAFVSSLKRLDWPFDFSDLLDQPLLMRDWLEPFREEMERTASSKDNLLEQACLLWRMVYEVVNRHQEEFPSIMVVRHEDLSLHPLPEFHQLYQKLGLSFKENVKQTIQSTSSSNNPQELSRQAVHSIQLDSRANLKNWQNRLSEQETAQIRQLTEDIAYKYYQDEDWK